MIDLNIENNTDWVSINSLSSIAVGTAIDIQNKWYDWGLLQESITKPLITDFTGIVITALGSVENNKSVSTGSDEVWVRSYYPNRSLKFNVQEV